LTEEKVMKEVEAEGGVMEREDSSLLKGEISNGVFFP
jgi:hypothetical protein